MKLREFNRRGEELSVLDVETGETVYISPPSREAVVLAARVLTLLNNRDLSQIESDDYDGTERVSEWLERKAKERAERRITRLAIIAGLALAACIAVIIIGT